MTRIKDFSILDMHGHRITNHLRPDGWEIHLMAPVKEGPVGEDGKPANWTLVKKCESLSEAIEAAKAANGGAVAGEVAEFHVGPTSEALAAPIEVAADTVEEGIAQAAGQIAEEVAGEVAAEPVAEVASDLPDLPTPPKP